ncbi:hypothetical protein QFZ94_004834 [Paraburkholderia sp. JPY465]|uniref:hypothetical protein n=1 Tax=Paraburkholderia sp. JPY465 TaxID=3042285 RepID=UPI003D192523
MTLEQLRTELESGTLGGPTTPAVPSTALGSPLNRRLLEIATRRVPGPRVQLPRELMPVLP